MRTIPTNSFLSLARILPSGLAFLLLASATARLCAQEFLGDADEQVIQYHRSDDLTDPVALLQKRLAAGTNSLHFEPQRGYLEDLLQALGIPRSSQTLVFSKTSSQKDQTTPQTPRAIYFSDNVSLGWVPGGKVIDLAAVDPRKGPIFYTLEQTASGPPRFTREEDCLRCHLGPKTLNVPGLLVRSVYTATNGTPLASVTDFVSGHNSPLEKRWAGWYVTGTHAGASHLGNVFATNPAHPEQIDPAAGANLTDLRSRLNTAPYLLPHSDIVALLVLEHQLRMQNLLTRANYDTRLALDQRAQAEIAASGLALDEPALPVSTKPARLVHSAPAALPNDDWSRQRIAEAGEQLLEYMLFRNEAPLKGPVQGTSTFASDFQAAGPFDSKGRSLRQLDLHTRLFRYPCSFLIYSPAFDALPKEMKSYLWLRLNQILTGRDNSSAYAAMSAPDRQAVFEILRDTKPEFAAWLAHAR